MIEVYKDTSEQIELRTYISGVRVNSVTTPEYTVYDVSDGSTVISTGDSTVVTGESAEYYAFLLTPEHTSTCRTLKVHWTYTLSTAIGNVTGQSFDYIDVVSPYVTPGELIAEFPEFASGGSNEKTFDELKSMERTIRHVIDTFCGQSFKAEYGVEKSVMGHDSNFLILNDRLMTLDTIELEDTDLTDYVETDADDLWTIRRKQDFGDTVKRDVENVFGRNFFKENRIYKVTGDWGWDYVPNEVNQAAKILVANAYCQEETYRQRYIDNLRAADFRIEFWYPSDETTGIANADLMLYQFRRYNVVII